MRGICLMIGLSLAACASWLPACDTPVYRYAMYRWAPAAYEVYLIHAQTLPAADAALADELDKQLEAEPARANFFFRRIDLSEENVLDGLPQDVRLRWEQQPPATRERPWWLVLNPDGLPLVEGGVDQLTLPALFDSPARRKINELLEAGNACVFVVLSGVAPLKDAGDSTDAAQQDSAPDQEATTAPGNLPATPGARFRLKPGSLKGLQENESATEQAIQVVDQVVREVNEGRVSLYQVPGSPAKGDQDDQPAHHVAMVRVARLDPQEQWLVRCLMAVEVDLYDYHEPMIFPVYGRARALPPFIGKGIDRDLLLENIEFVTGACSCTVKDQNPGVDLLTLNDWEAAAAKVAEKFGAEEGNESQLSVEDFFPDLVVPEPIGKQPTPDALAGLETPATADASSASGSPDTADAADTEDAPDTANAPDAEDASDAEGASDARPWREGTDAAERKLADSDDRDESASGLVTEQLPRGRLVVGIGIAAAVCILFVVTLLVMKNS